MQFASGSKQTVHFPQANEAVHVAWAGGERRSSRYSTRHRWPICFRAIKSVISRHMRNVFAEGELDAESNVQKKCILLPPAGPSFARQADSIR